MNCLRNLAKNHKISILTSIHQPNNEIVLMFDKIYVLAKGGNCLFSGAPNLIRSHLFDNNIIFDEKDVPIEQLLKISSNESQEYFNEIIERMKNKLKLEFFGEQDYLKITSGLRSLSKSFNPSDVWHIMLRTMTVKYIREWKALFLQFLLYISIAFCVCNMFGDNISKPSGCFTLSNDSCIEDLENNINLVQNHNFLFFITFIVQCIHICYSTTSYLIDVKIFINEHDNSEYFLFFNKLICLITRPYLKVFKMVIYP